MLWGNSENTFKMKHINQQSSYQYVPTGTLTPQNKKVVFAGQFEFSANPDDVHSVHGIGSCTIVAIYDVKKKHGGLYHILLPNDQVYGRTVSQPLHFANKGLPVFLQKFSENGSLKRNLRIAVIGGLENCSFDMGRRNYEYVMSCLAENNFPVSYHTFGGIIPLSTSLYIRNGVLHLYSADRKWKLEVDLTKSVEESLQAA